MSSEEVQPVGFPGCRLCAFRSAARPDICGRCLASSPGQSPPPTVRYCASCGQRLRSPGSCPTLLCGRGDREWSVVFAVGVHAGGLRRAIARYKYGGERWWAGVFARLLAGYLEARATWLEEFDVIVPMPAYTGRGARRGWDPVAEVVGELDRLVGTTWCIETGLVRRVAEVPAMSGTSRAVRARIAAGELRSALEVPTPQSVEGARILVVDDVLAEGSTLREVARVLRHAGAAEVAGLVLARPDWHGYGPDHRSRRL